MRSGKYHRDLALSRIIKSKKAKTSFPLLGLLLLAGQAQAVNEFELKQEEFGEWTAYFNASYTRNVYSESAFDAYRAYSLDARVDYNSDWGSVLLTFGGEKETLHGKESSFFDPLLEYRTPLYSLTETLSLKGSIGVYLPAAHYTKLDRLEYAPRVAAYLFYRPEGNFSFYLSPRYRYNAYKYKTAGERVLIEHQVDLVADAYWQFASNWYLDISGRYRMSKNYRGRRMDDQFTFAQELGWMPAESWTLAIGHNNSGRFYHPELGSSEGFELYDKRSSTFYFSVTKYL